MNIASPSWLQMPELHFHRPLWLLALLALLAGAVMGFSHWIRLFSQSAPPQPLDDAPPPAPPKDAVRFGSDRF